MSASEPTTPLSPCNSICRIDPLTRLCIGCGRTMEEIGRWSSLSDPQRLQVMRLLPTRMRKLVRQREAAGLEGRPKDQ